MSQKTREKPRTKVKAKIERPPLWKVILLNDDYTPREFVVVVLKAVFRMNESHAYKVMMTAHQNAGWGGPEVHAITVTILFNATARLCAAHICSSVSPCLLSRVKFGNGAGHG